MEDNRNGIDVKEDKINRSGFVNIIGNPNVGKSTLMNALVGEKLSIVTAKAQTTRHRIMGIVNGDDYQIVFSDTPGILKPSYELQEAMMNFVDTAIGDADIIIYVTDVYESSEKNKEYVDKLNLLSCPVIVVVNKIDKLLGDAAQAGSGKKAEGADAARRNKHEEHTVEDLVEKWHGLVPKAEILPMSALNKINTDLLLKKIVSLLPQQHAWYDRDVLTDKNLRFFASEILREKILENYSKEIPYCAEVVIEQFIEEEEM